MSTELPADLCQVPEIQLSYHGPVKNYARQVSTAEKAHQLLRAAWDENRIELVEQFKIMLLDNSKHCLGIAEIGSGGYDKCLIDPRLVFATALKAPACSIVLAHNHPSGSIKPSKADIIMTERLASIGQFLQIEVLDHIILTKDSYLSMQSEAVFPPPRRLEQLLSQ